MDRRTLRIQHPVHEKLKKLPETPKDKNEAALTRMIDRYIVFEGMNTQIIFYIYKNEKDFFDGEAVLNTR